MAWFSASFRLPSVAHIFSSARKQQVCAHTIVLIAYCDASTAIEAVCQIKSYLRLWEQWDYVSVNSESTDTTVRVHKQFYMSKRLFGVFVR